jgi:hypothetical protein
MESLTGYPATTKRVTGFVNGLSTDAMVVGFADKILITLAQEGRLAQWVRIRLSSFFSLPRLSAFCHFDW